VKGREGRQTYLGPKQTAPLVLARRLSVKGGKKESNSGEGKSSGEALWEQARDFVMNGCEARGRTKKKTDEVDKASTVKFTKGKKVSP